MAKTGYWTEGKLVNGTNVGGGKFVEGAAPSGGGGGGNVPIRNYAQESGGYGSAGEGSGPTLRPRGQNETAAEYADFIRSSPFLIPDSNSGSGYRSASQTDYNNFASSYIAPVQTPVSTTVNGSQLGSQAMGAIGQGIGANYFSKIYGDNAGLGKIDPATGMLIIDDEEKKKDQPKKDKTQEEYMKEALDFYNKEPEVNSEQIRRQADNEAGLDAARQQKNNTQGAINAITAKMNADLLQLRDVGSREGVTEAVYGGQQATISREATIKLLPLQAQLAVDQGNFQMAQERADDLFKLRFEDATRKADRWMKAAERGYDNYTKAEQKKLDGIKQVYSDRKSIVSDLTNYAQTVGMEALQAGNTNAWKSLTNMQFPDPTSANFESQLAAVKNQIAKYGGTIEQQGRPMQLSDGRDVLVDQQGNIIKTIGGAKTKEEKNVFDDARRTVQQYKKEGYSRADFENEYRKANAANGQSPEEVELPLTVKKALDDTFGAEAAPVTPEKTPYWGGNWNPLNWF